MRQDLAAVSACATLLVALILGTLALGRTAARPPNPVLAQAGESSRCIAEHSKLVGPEVIPFGATTSVTLTAGFQCPDDPVRRHVVLVLESAAELESMAIDLLRKLDPSDEDTLVGVVAFDDGARRLCDLLDNPDRTKSCIRRLTTESGRRIDRGIDEGVGVLLDGRGDSPEPGTLHETQILFAFGASDTGCDDVTAAANRARDEGIALVAVCVGPDCAPCLRQAAGPERFYQLESASQLPSVLAPIADAVPRSGVSQLTVTDLLPANMAYVPYSAHPRPSSLSADGKRLVWHMRTVQASDMEITYQVEPFALGTHPANVEATGAFTDGWGRTGAFTFDVPMVTIDPPDPGGESPCRSDQLTNTVQPTVVKQGDTVTNVFHLRVTCPDEITARERSVGPMVDVGRLTVTDTLPIKARYVEGSAIPEPTRFELSGRRLIWETDTVPVDGLTFTLRFELHEPGEHPTSKPLSASFTDTDNRRGFVWLPVPSVVVEPVRAPEGIFLPLARRE